MLARVIAREVPGDACVAWAHPALPGLPSPVWAPAGPPLGLAQTLTLTLGMMELASTFPRHSLLRAFWSTVRVTVTFSGFNNFVSPPPHRLNALLSGGYTPPR